MPNSEQKSNANQSVILVQNQTNVPTHRYSSKIPTVSLLTMGFHYAEMMKGPYLFRFFLSLD